MAAHHMDMAAVSVGGFVALGKLVEAILEHLGHAAPWLSSLSYIAALVVAVITIYYKVKNKGK